MATLRYQLFQGKATLVKLGDFTLLFIHDERINPQRQVLKFSSPLKSDPDIDLHPDTSSIQENIQVIIGFDQVWFDQTKRNGFAFTKDGGSPVINFTDLDVPNEATMDRMNPVRP